MTVEALFAARARKLKSCTGRPSFCRSPPAEKQDPPLVGCFTVQAHLPTGTRRPETGQDADARLTAPQNFIPPLASGRNPSHARRHSAVAIPPLQRHDAASPPRQFSTSRPWSSADRRRSSARIPKDRAAAVMAKQRSRRDRRVSDRRGSIGVPIGSLRAVNSGDAADAARRTVLLN